MSTTPFSTVIRILATLACLLFLTSVNAEQNNSIADDVLEKSGSYQLLFGVPDMIRTQGQSQLSGKDPALAQYVINRLISQFEPDKLKNRLRKSVIASLDPVQLLAIQQWLDSGLGQRITAAETAISTPDGQRRLLEYAATLANHPIDEDKLLIAQQLVDVVGAVDIVVNVLREVIFGMAYSSNLALPLSQQLSKTEIDEKISEDFMTIEPVLRENLRQRTIVTTLYHFESFSDSDIQSYLSYLHSNSGRDYIHLADLTLKTISLFFVEAVNQFPDVAPVPPQND